MAAALPTALIRLPSTTMMPLSMTPPSSSAIVTIRAPASTIVPSGTSASTRIDRDTPVAGGS